MKSSFPIKDAIDTMTEAMKDDDIAWSWHCNIAVQITDEGVDWHTAQKAASRIMSHLFGRDTSDLVNKNVFLYGETK